MKRNKIFAFILSIITVLSLISLIAPEVEASDYDLYVVHTNRIPDKVTTLKNAKAYNVADDSYYGYIKQGTACELKSWRLTPGYIKQYVLKYPDGLQLAINEGDFVETCYYKTINNNANIIYDYLLNSTYTSATYTETIFSGRYKTEFESFVQLFNYRYYGMTDCGYEDRVMQKPALVYTKIKNHTYKIDLTASRKNLNLEKNILKSLKLNGKTDLQKVVAIEKYIANNMSYDYNLVKKINNNTTDKASNGPFTCLNLRKGICSDYASTYYYLANAAGIKTYFITGYAGESHSWNCSYINGKWYYIDVCFYDSNKNALYLGSTKPFANRTINAFLG